MKTVLTQLIEMWENEIKNIPLNEAIYRPFINDAKSLLEEEKDQLISFAYAQIEEIYPESGNFDIEKLPQEIFKNLYEQTV